MNTSPRPWWLAVIVIILLLPAFAIPELLTLQSEAAGNPFPDTVKALTWLFPLVCVAYAILIWLCWPTRRFISWMLVVMSALTSAAIFAVMLV
ncbi:MAG: hypothetical protein NC187_03075 [Candidatus Amulumruptor caecigallinarius]|nr:hypothetical protein [Candidatus Amulumruptor caecigallinarius]MCM1396458.1 hypothetical protein [Candidatus Amulumruptor caecigallinarius]MCM1453485.1 hypothetical protein [bacterium]